MKTTAISAVALAALTLSACARGPESIAPVAMPAGSYSSMSCATAAAERSRVATELAALESQQRGAVAGDAIGVLLIGVPVASLTGGDHAGDISVSKGKALSLDAHLMNCATAPQS